MSSYDDLADAVRKHSANPADDLASLLKHTLFNGLIGNTDDHLKNFTMLHENGGYRLSPAYDLLPDIHANREHVLFFAEQRYLASRSSVTDMAQRWGIANPIGILEEVLAGLSRFKDFAELAGVPAPNVAEIEKDLERRAGMIA